MCNYQIIITKNDEKFRFIAKYVTKKNAIQSFDKIIKENEKVKFEKKLNNHEPVKYKLELLTNKKEYGVLKYEKDDLGRNVLFEPKDGWYKLKRVNYKIPESFVIYGYPSRYQFDDLYGFFNSINEENTFISMSRIFNTLILEAENTPPMIITLKNEKECKRLYNTIVNEKIPNILAFGHMDKTNRKKFYRKMETLMIPLMKFYRNSTR